MSVREALRRVGKALRADVQESSDGTVWLELELARRQAGGRLKRLRYRVALEVHEAGHTVYFQEWLWEEDASLAIELAPRFAEREQAFRIAGAASPGSVESAAPLLAKRYGTAFDFPDLRRRLQLACLAEGYHLRHLIPL